MPMNAASIASCKSRALALCDRVLVSLNSYAKRYGHYPMGDEVLLINSKFAADLKVLMDEMNSAPVRMDDGSMKLYNHRVLFSAGVPRNLVLVAAIKAGYSFRDNTDVDIMAGFGDEERAIDESPIAHEEG